MNFDAIITEYYNKQDIIDFFKKVSFEWWKELRQEIFLILCEYDKDKVIEMHQKKYLKFFIVRITLNQFRSKHSKFYYKNIKNGMLNDSIQDTSDLINSDKMLFEMYNDDIYKLEELIEKENKLQRIEVAKCNLRYFESELLRLYYELGSFKAINEKTGIPTRSVSFAVKNAINNLKDNI